MGCGVSTGVGLIDLKKNELKKIRYFSQKEKSTPDVQRYWSEAGEPFGALVIQIMEDSLQRCLHHLIVNELRLVTLRKAHNRVNDVHLLQAASVTVCPGGTLPSNMLVVMTASKHPVQLQTTPEFLQALVNALRQGLATLTVGTPPQFLPFTFKAPQSMIKPLKEVRLDGQDGGFSNQFKGFLTLLRQSSGDYLMFDQPNGKGYLYASPDRPKSINRGPTLWVKDVCQLQASGKSLDDKVAEEVAALRSLRFNLHFTALNLTDCVDDSKGTLWRTLTEIFGYNVSLSEIHMPNLNLPSANWVALGQSLLYNPRPFFTVWDLQDNNLQDAGLVALLPGLSRIFYTISPPQYLDFSYNNLTANVVLPLMQMLTGTYDMGHPDTNLPPPTPPYLGKLIFLGLSGCNLREQCDGNFASALKQMRSLQTLLLDECMLIPADFSAVTDALIESGCPLQKLGMGNTEVVSNKDSISGSLNRLLVAKQKTMRTIICNLSQEVMTSAMLSNLMQSYSQDFPDIMLEVMASSFQQEIDQEEAFTQGSKSWRSFSQRQRTDGNIGGLQVVGFESIANILAACSAFQLKKLVILGGQGQKSSKQIFEVVVPQGISPGQQFMAMAGTKQVMVNCPPNSLPGQKVKIELPSIRTDDPNQVGEMLAVLVKNNTLESLIIPGGVDPMQSSIYPLFDALPETTTLKELDVSNHRFQDEGAIRLGQALRKNRSIMKLWFDGNLIGLDGLKGFRGCLYGNKKLVEVGLPYNDFGLYQDFMQKQIKAGTHKEIQLRANIKTAYRLKQGYHAQRQAIDIMVENKKAYKAMIRASDKAEKIFADIKKDCDRNLKLYNEKVAAKAEERRQRQRGKYVEKWQTKQLTIKQRLQAKVAKIKQKQKKDQIVTKKYKYYDKSYNDPYRRKRDDKGDYYMDPYGNHYYYISSGPSYRYYDEPYYGMSEPPPPHHDFHVGEEQPPAPGEEELVDLGQVSGEQLPEGWEPTELPEANVDNLDRMDELLQDPQFFEPDNLAEFDRLANEMGQDVGAEFESGLGQAGNLSDQIATQSENWGTDITQELAEQDVPFEGLPTEEEPEEELEPEEVEEESGEEGGLEDVEAYGGAGPRDLPDGGPSGGRSDGKVHSGCLAATLRKESLLKNTIWPKVDEAPAKAESLKLAKMKAERTSFMLETVSKYSPLQPLDYTMLPHHMVSTKIMDNPQVTLVTQCSVDRLPFLKQQLHAWGGMASVAVYINTESISRKNQEMQLVEHFFSHMESESTACLDIGIIFGLEEKPWLDCSESPLYPINTLRNLALFQAKEHPSPMVFLVDADFLPSSGLHNILENDTKISKLLLQNESKEALIIPAFELAANSNSEGLPRSKQAVEDLWRKGKVMGFHTSYYPQGHAPTDFDKWMNASGMYKVNYQQNFEPYVVVSKANVPNYDERFRGYGMNKISHLLNMHKLGTSFSVLPSEFVVAQPHPRSESWQNVYGEEKDVLMKYRLQSLWNEFNEMMKLNKPPVLSRVTKDLLKDDQEKSCLSDQKGGVNTLDENPPLAAKDVRKAIKKIAPLNTSGNGKNSIICPDLISTKASELLLDIISL